MFMGLVTGLSLHLGLGLKILKFRGLVDWGLESNVWGEFGIVGLQIQVESEILYTEFGTIWC